MLDNLTERHLAAIAVALGAKEVSGWSSGEKALTEDLPFVSRETVRRIRGGIDDAKDPLGAAFCHVRTPEARRPQGATYTPRPILRAMLRWAANYYLGNPPYVRHHLISSEWKSWLTRTAAALQLPESSQLAGLHVYFYLATALKARQGDFGAFITAAEWLDVNYGRVLRDLFVGPLSGRSITIIEPTAQPFPDAAATAAIACFDIGSQSRSIRLKRVAALPDLKRRGLDTGRIVRRERLEAAHRWSPLT